MTSRNLQRSANLHSFGDSTGDCDDGEDGESPFPEVDDDFAAGYQAFVADQTNAARLPDEPWNALSREGKSAWHQVPVTDREVLVKFMQSMQTREKRQVNMASMAAIDEVEETDDEVRDEEPTMEVNKAASKPSKSPMTVKTSAQSKVNANHSGDIRRVLSSPGKPGKAPRQVNTMEFKPDPSYSAFTVQRTPVDAAIDNYWANTTQVSYRGGAKESGADSRTQDFRRGGR